MNTDLNIVREHVELYFNEHLKQYTVQEIRKKSTHPDDGHLYMVSARHDKGTFGVWTNWNESIQSLNHGHYNLISVDDCERLFEEYQRKQQFFAVYKYSQNVKYRLFVTESEEAARNFCEEKNWELMDENCFVWSLCYEEAGGSD